MKNIILIITIIAFVGCKEETPTEQKVNIDKKYTLDELENDPDWVEVTDIDTLDAPCIHPEIYKEGKILFNENDFNSLYTESVRTYGELDEEICNNVFSKYLIDTTKNCVIFYFNKTNKYPLITRRVFKSVDSNKLIYFVEIKRTSGNEGGDIYIDRIKVPKLNEIKIITSKIE